MAFGRRSSSGGGAHRRSGPAEEDPWWNPQDQAFAESNLLGRSDLRRGWIPASMVNNIEQLDPYVDDADSAVLCAIRAERRLTALDEGQAWRRRSGGILAVLRVEVFADPDSTAHRDAWREHGARCLDAVWRQR